MRKLLLIILLLTASHIFAQDTIYKFVDFGKPTQVKLIGIINGQDTVWKESGKGSSQGMTDTTEVIQELMNVQKAYKDLYEQKVKELETKDADLIRLQGIILYLNEKLNVMRKK